MAEIVVVGVVKRVTFHEPLRGFSVIKLLADAQAEGQEVGREALFNARAGLPRVGEPPAISVVGTMPTVNPGDRVRVVGRYAEGRHGLELRASVVTILADTSREGIVRLLANSFKGVGPVLADRIVEKFGLDTIGVLDRCPERLAEVPGISKKKAVALAASFSEARAEREASLALASLALPEELVRRVLRRYGSRAAEIVKQSPYRLAIEVSGIGFKTADAIAHRVFGVAKNSPERAQAAVLAVLVELSDLGHVVSPRAEIEQRTASLLEGGATQEESPSTEVPSLSIQSEVPLELARCAVDVLLGAGLLRSEGSERAFSIGLPNLVDAERRLADRLFAKLGAACPQARSKKGTSRKDQQDALSRLSPTQQLAVESARERGVLVITGGPGTGKTTLVRALSQEFADKRLILAAPTGRAARRLSSATGLPAQTLHRLLEVDPKTHQFARNGQNTIPADVVIVDEVSMVDIVLGESLLSALEPGTRLILVGDDDQLPPVGPGALLRDVLEAQDASGNPLVPRVRLLEVFRQARGSAIVTAAHEILQGRQPTPSPPRQAADSTTKSPSSECLTSTPVPRPAGELFIILREDAEATAQVIVELMRQRLSRSFGLNERTEVQVLLPTQKGPLGVIAMNERLAQALLPGQSDSFAVGTRVMQLRNDYEREVFNGDVGFVVGRGPSVSEARPRHVKADPDATFNDDRNVTVEWEDGRRTTFDRATHLRPAWACTVHKSQGSEYPAVIIGLSRGHSIMLERRLLYTAVTRAKALCVIVGSRIALERAVADFRGVDRRTTLRGRLEALARGANG